MKTTQPLLIDTPESLSPKLKFLIRNGLTSKATSKSWWTCDLTNPPQKGGGRNEAEAVIDWCEKNQVKHYSIE